MPDENILQGARPEYTSAWRAREMALWSQGVRRSIMPLTLLGSALRIFGLLEADIYSQSLPTVIVAIALFGYSFYMAVAPSGFERLKSFALLQVLQAYLLTLATTLSSEYKELWIVSSTVVFAMYEVSSFNGGLLTVVLLVRQFAMWSLVGVSENKMRSVVNIPTFILLGTGTMVLVISQEMKRKAQEYYRFCNSIEEHEMKLTAVLQAIPEGLVVLTEGLKVACFNSRLQQSLKVSSAEELCTRLQTLVCQHSESGVVPLGAQIFEFMSDRKRDFCSFGVSEHEGSYYEWKGTKCCWGDSRACIITASDNTSWVEVNAKLREESDSKSQLLRFVSHELRTPTNAILNLTTDVMTAGNLQQKHKNELSIVVTSTHFLLSVVNDLLDFSRIIADKFSLSKHSFNLRHEITEVCRLIELQCQQKSLQLHLKFDPLVPDLIYSDANRVKQVLLNLLGNALKFTFYGEIRVVCMLTDHDTLRISVKDTGIGIPRDKIAGLCRAFETVEAAKGVNPQGCGLGLYISNFLAISLGGKAIEIHSKPGRGSEFGFEVHIYQEARQVEVGYMDATTEVEDERECESVVAAPRYDGGRFHFMESANPILLVDDSDFNRLVMQRMLETLNLQADEANSGLKAVAKVREGIRRGHYYRLILMDIEMPEMDGPTATSEIRTMEVTQELPLRPRIVACSAHRERQDFDRCMAAGMDDYMEKPISRDRLQEVVSAL